MSDGPNYAEKIGTLHERVGETVPIKERKKLIRVIPLILSHGYLWIDEEKEHWSITVASGKTTHHPFAGRSYGADFLKSNGERKFGPLDYRGAWKSALSMWPVTAEPEASQIFNYVAGRVDQAYRYHILDLR